ncbi:MAG: hypothetical protein Kow0088_14150 [Anaerolineales bacterium]
MTDRTLSDRDYELISAYLDGEVDDHQRKAIEYRLAEDAPFKLALERLSQTRQILRSQPQLRAPRNYTLSPKMLPASSPKGWGIFPGLLRTASALASLLFFILFGMNWFAMGRMIVSAPLEQREAAFQEAAPTEMGAEQPALNTGIPSPEQPTAKGVAPPVHAPNIPYPPLAEIGGMGGGEGDGQGTAGALEAPLLEPYSTTLLIAPTATLSTTLPSSDLTNQAEMPNQNEIAPKASSYPQSPVTPEAIVSPSHLENERQRWWIRQILYGILAISFAFIAIRFRKR